MEKIRIHRDNDLDETLRIELVTSEGLINDERTGIWFVKYIYH